LLLVDHPIPVSNLLYDDAIEVYHFFEAYGSSLLADMGKQLKYEFSLLEIQVTHEQTFVDKPIICSA